MRERLTSPRGGSRLLWAPAAKCAAPLCTSREHMFGEGGFRRCARCHAKWGEERAIMPAFRARRHGLEGPFAELGDLCLVISAPRNIWACRSAHIYLAGGHGTDGYPYRAESKGDFEGVASYMRSFWGGAQRHVTINGHNVRSWVREWRVDAAADAAKRGL